jgi:hypothetical protein
LRARNGYAAVAVDARRVLPALIGTGNETVERHGNSKTPFQHEDSLVQASKLELSVHASPAIVWPALADPVKIRRDQDVPKNSSQNDLGSRCATPQQAVRTKWLARQRAPAESGLHPRHISVGPNQSSLAARRHGPPAPRSRRRAHPHLSVECPRMHPRVLLSVRRPRATHTTTTLQNLGAPSRIVGGVYVRKVVRSDAVKLKDGLAEADTSCHVRFLTMTCAVPSSTRRCASEPCPSCRRHLS